MWLKFDEAAGATTFADSSGQNNNGSCAGNACPVAGVAGKDGQALQFDGVNDGVRVNLNGPDGLYTLAAWVKFTGTWRDWNTILEFGSSEDPWFGARSEAGQLALYNFYGGAVPVGQWVHVAYTYAGAGQAARSRLYINGKLVQKTDSDPHGKGGQGLSIGMEPDGNFPWQGLIDDLRIYNRALNEAEIGALANPGSAPVPKPQPPAEGEARPVDLTISIYKQVRTAADRKPYEEIIKLFADSIYEMSNGAHKIRTVTIYDDARFADRADVKWTEAVWPKANPSGYGRTGLQVKMGDTDNSSGISYKDPKNWPEFGYASFGHEWGHYFYGLMDEYSQQTGDTPPNPDSIMASGGSKIEQTGQYWLLNFSTWKSTAGANRTASDQYRTFGASGWETVARPPAQDPRSAQGRLHWPELAKVAPQRTQDPSVELPAGQAQARSALNIVWADPNAVALKHRVFLIDVSVDMGQMNKLNSVKAALKNYVDRANVGDMIGLITFAGTHSVVQELTRIEGAATKTAIKTKIDGIQASATSNDRKVESADQAALAALKQAENSAVILDKSVFVFIDGGFTDQTDPPIFQKVYNAHNAAGIPMSIFNFFPGMWKETEPGKDLYTNSTGLLPWVTRNTNGTYKYVGGGVFTIPTARNSADNHVPGDAEMNELVDALTDTDQIYSPIVDVNLGTDRDLVVTPGTPFTTTIFVDSTLDWLEVSVAHSGAETDAQLTLLDPDGANSDPPLCDSDGIDTLCFFDVAAPITGTWELKVEAGAGPVDLEYRSTGYAEEGFTYQALLESLSGDLVSYPQPVILQASVGLEQRIAKAGVEAWVEGPDGNFFDLSFKDDGVAPDEMADDGFYTSVMSYTLPGDYYVTLVFDNIDGNAVFTDRGDTDVPESEGEPVGIDFDRFASLELFVDDYAADDYGNTQETATDLVTDNVDVPGRIDSAGDVDVFRITPALPLPGDPKHETAAAGATTPVTETVVLRLGNFAFGMDAVVKITSGGATQTHNVGALAYDAYWTTPLELTGGELAYVQVSHGDAQASSGSYEISVGEPLFGEPGYTAPTATWELSLPVIIRE
ncbi:MAG: VWA domain-containing protein [Chloroflexi bacterium]|nr:VWA domain-containing protein [Chloroflexota bacterium]